MSREDPRLRVAEARWPGSKPAPRHLPPGQAGPATTAYLGVFIVTFPIHEIPDECFVLVHLSQANPAGRQGQVGEVPMPAHQRAVSARGSGLARWRMTGLCTCRVPPALGNE